MINKYFNAAHMDPSSSLVVSLRTMLLMLSFHCSHLANKMFTPGSPFMCAFCLAQNWTQLWSKRLPRKGFIGRYMCMKTHNIREHLFYQPQVLQMHFYAIKIALRYYFHLSDWPIFRSWTTHSFWRGCEETGALYKADVYTKWINATGREFYNNLIVIAYSFSLCGLL